MASIVDRIRISTLKKSTANLSKMMWHLKTGVDVIDKALVELNRRDWES
jgi:hypothetical protein